MEEGHYVLSDGFNRVESRGTYNDGNSHTCSFSRKGDGSLKLSVDDTDRRMISRGDPGFKLPPLAVNNSDDEIARFRRVAPRRRNGNRLRNEFNRAPTHVFIGGSTNGPRFKGCIGNIHIAGDPRHPRKLTEGARCGFNPTVLCVGKPILNGCNLGPIYSSNDLDISSYMMPRDMPQGGDGKKRKKNRNRSGRGNRDKEQVRPPQAASWMLPRGYDEGCNLPLVPRSSGYKYPGKGYMKYSMKDFQTLNWRFSMKIRTMMKEGIIFFMCSPGCPEHIAIYLIKGKVAVSVKFGHERKRFKTEERFNDGRWHHVSMERRGHDLQLMVDGGIQTQIFPYDSNTFTDVMLFYIGGLQEMEKEDASVFINRTHLADFTGCIQNVQVNDDPVEESASLMFNSNLRSCFQGGSEHGMFFPDIHPREGAAFLLVLNSYNVGTNLVVSMEIRPRAASGILFAVGGSNEDYFQLFLTNGKVVARLKQSTDILMSVYIPADFGHAICDGNWHKIKVMKAKHILMLTVDGNQVNPIEQGNEEIRSCNTDGPVYIGGLPERHQVGQLLATREQYTGCMRKVRVDSVQIATDSSIWASPRISATSCPTD